jgi:hypothetical protein
LSLDVARINMPHVESELRRRRAVAGAAAVVAAIALAFPVLAASPSPSAAPGASAKAHDNGNGRAKGQGAANQAGAKPDKSHAPETPVTLNGPVAKGTDADGQPTLTLEAGGKTYELSAGPPWFWGDKNPLNAYVGKTVTIAGSSEGAGTEVDVETVDGKAIRDPGKPPWAGGPKVVGASHPGYKAWKDAQPGASTAP